MLHPRNPAWLLVLVALQPDAALGAHQGSPGSGFEATFGAGAVALIGDGAALFENPAALARADRPATEIGGESTWDVQGLRFGAHLPTLQGPVWGIGYTRWESLLEPARLPVQNTVQLGVAQRIGFGLAAGGALELHSQEAAGVRDESFGMDLALQWRPNLNADHAPLWQHLAAGLVLDDILEPHDDPANHRDRRGVRTGVAWSQPLGGGWSAGVVLGIEAAQDTRRALSGTGCAQAGGVQLALGVVDGDLTAGAALDRGTWRIGYALVGGTEIGQHVGVQLRFGPGVQARRVEQRRTEELQMAANAMQIVSAERSSEFETWIERAQAALAHGQYDASADLYALALAREPYNVRARTGLKQARHAARVQEADNLIQAGDHEGAVRALEQALVIAPEDSASAERLLAARRAAHAADRTQSEIARKFQAGIEAYAQQRFVDAVHHFDEVLRLDRHHTAAAAARKQARNAHEMRVRGGLRRARALLDARDYDQARAVLRQLLELIPQNSEARKLLALAESRAEVAHRAENTHLAAGTPGEDAAPAPATPVGPEVARLYDQGMQLYRSGDLVGAMRAWEDVAGRAPHFEEVDQYLLRVYRVTGLESYTEGRLREAVEIWEKALQLEPDNEQLRRYVNQAQAKLARAQSSDAAGRP